MSAEDARFTLLPTPARRTIDIVFEGKPDIEAVRAAVAGQDIAGACVRVRWTVADEDRHEVDRAAIQRMLDGAAEVKLEGRIVPVVRTRAAGIAQLASLAEKVRAWAQVTQSQPAPLLACLDALATQSPEDIADCVLRGPLHESSTSESEEDAVTPDVSAGMKCRSQFANQPYRTCLEP